ncbi:hypothetical protein FIU94_16060 [Sulfitobacter sp. THAF37]|uniref:hypothetical protein n=1 Tax=Sulfitobacter sp. THAF37 TaxID=2587855 RepID=UPI001267AD63|nr:hypothetical protein [Sulfitobacter sp. THAF37]QFT60344.1 hypothetical protein FIU94_16060 [Sulfitobacter sp. THAF37]
MSCSRVIRIAAVACLFFGGAAVALPVSPSERATLFAICAGRLSAVETYWGRQPAGARDSATFDTLMEAALPAAIEDGMPLSVAQNAKFHAWRSHAFLRNDAEFSPDQGRRARAHDRLARELRECSDLIR